MKRKKVTGFADMNTGDNRSKRPDEIVEMLNLTDDYLQVRIIGQPAVYAQHWIPIETPKGGTVNIPRTVPNFDSSTDSFDDTITDPYLDIPNEVSTRKMYFVNVIVRDDQDDKPRKLFSHIRREKKTGFKSKDSKSWTPVKVLRMPTTVVRQIQRIITMNKHKVHGKIREYELSHPLYGCDIFISFDKNQPGPNMYSLQKGDHSKLSKEEKEYLIWDLNGLLPPPLSLKEASKDAKALAESCPNSDDDEEGDEDWIEKMDKKRKKSKGKKKRTDIKKKRTRVREQEDGEESKKSKRRKESPSKRRKKRPRDRV